MPNDGVPIDPPNLPASAPELNAPVGTGNAPGSKATQFKAGEPRPPNAGRKPGSLNRATIFQKVLEAKASEFFRERVEKGFPGVDQETAGDQLAAMLFIHAMNGDRGAAALIFDSALGKQEQKIKMTVTPLGKVLEEIEQTETGLPNVE